MESGGYPPKRKYLFLGNYVNRGKYSLEVICLILSLKVKHPDMVYMLRGKHETGCISRIYGFYDECKRRYSIKLWKLFIRVFDLLPIAATINDTIFCVHSGLSPELTYLEEINTRITRPCDVPDCGLLCDLLWSNPVHYEYSGD